MSSAGCIRLSAIDGNRHLISEVAVDGGKLAASADSEYGISASASAVWEPIRPQVTYGDNLICVVVPQNEKVDVYTMLYCPYTIAISSFSYDFNNGFEA